MKYQREFCRRARRTLVVRRGCATRLSREIGGKGRVYDREKVDKGGRVCVGYRASNIFLWILIVLHWPLARSLNAREDSAAGRPRSGRRISIANAVGPLGAYSADWARRSARALRTASAASLPPPLCACSGSASRPPRADQQRLPQDLDRSRTSLPLSRDPDNDADLVYLLQISRSGLRSPWPRPAFSDARWTRSVNEHRVPRACHRPRSQACGHDARRVRTVSSVCACVDRTRRKKDPASSYDLRAAGSKVRRELSRGQNSSEYVPHLCVRTYERSPRARGSPRAQHRALAGECFFESCEVRHSQGFHPAPSQARSAPAEPLAKEPDCPPRPRPAAVAI